MACNKNYNFKVDLSNIEKDKKGCFDWKNSIGRPIPFECDKFSGELRILNYNIKTKNLSVKIITERKEGIGEINVGVLKKSKLSGLLKDFLFEWAYEVGEKFYNDNGIIIIEDRRYVDKQEYKVKCGVCGYDWNGCYDIYSKSIKNELWVNKNQLDNGKVKCPVCNKNTKKVVIGHDDIATTDPWMVKFFKNKEDAKTHSAYSKDQVRLVCPDCGSEKDYVIGRLKAVGHLPCGCRDNISTPNKISYYTLKYLCGCGIIYNYQREYNPSWAKPYRYDNYFEFDGKKYIIEMDGGLGHGKSDFCGGIDKDGKKRDEIKNRLAKENNVILHRVNCVNKEDNSILDGLIHELTNIVGHEPIINKKDILSNASKNIVKEVCLLYNEGKSLPEISHEVDLSTKTIREYLRKGNDAGFCKYITISENRTNMINKVSKMIDDDKNITVKQISNALQCNIGTAYDYAHQLDDNRREILSKNGTATRGRKSGAATRERKNKFKISKDRKVYVYNLNGNYINTYGSQSEIERRSLEDFGIELKSRAISRVCTGKRKQYKGYIFSFTPLHE